jgi:hypothetical protein
VKPCRHLDYTEGKFTDCTIETCAPHYPEVKFWRRGERWTDYEGAPVKVQFCRLRGRINGIFGCYNGEMGCYDPFPTDEAAALAATDAGQDGEGKS